MGSTYASTEIDTGNPDKVGNQSQSEPRVGTKIAYVISFYGQPDDHMTVALSPLPRTQ